MFRNELLELIPQNIYSKKETEKYLNRLIGECCIYIDKDFLDSTNFSVSNVISSVLELETAIELNEDSSMIINFKGELYKGLQYVKYDKIDQFLRVNFINFNNYKNGENKYNKNYNDKNLFFIINEDNKKIEKESFFNLENEFCGENIYLIFSKRILDLSEIYNAGLTALPMTSSNDSVQIDNIKSFIQIDDSRKQQIKKEFVEKYNYLLTKDRSSNSENFQHVIKKVNENKRKVKNDLEEINSDLQKEFFRIKSDLTNLSKLENEIEKGDVSVNAFTHSDFVKEYFDAKNRELEKKINEATKNVNKSAVFHFENFEACNDCNIIKFNKPDYCHIPHERYSNGHIIMDGIGSILKLSAPYRMFTMGSWIEELAENIMKDAKNEFLPYFEQYISGWKSHAEINLEKLETETIKKIEQSG